MMFTLGAKQSGRRSRNACTSNRASDTTEDLKEHTFAEISQPLLPVGGRQFCTGTVGDNCSSAGSRIDLEGHLVIVRLQVE